MLAKEPASGLVVRSTASCPPLTEDTGREGAARDGGTEERGRHEDLWAVCEGAVSKAVMVPSWASIRTEGMKEGEERRRSDGTEGGPEEMRRRPPHSLRSESSWAQ